MNLNDYQEAVKRTCATSGNHGETIKMAGFGLSGEVGEINDALKKYIWHEHKLDLAHLVDEAGDLLWYLATLCNEFDISLEDVIDNNVEKLHRRYPDGFSSERSINRADPREQMVLDAISRNDPAHLMEITQDCQCSEAEALAIVAKLVEQGNARRLTETLFTPARGVKGK